MTFADANVVLDFCGLAPVRSERALQALQMIEQNREAFVVTEGALVEVFWVLEKSYMVSNNHAVAVVDSVLSSSEFKAWDPLIADYALQLKLQVPRLSILDCILASRAILDGDEVISHDKLLNHTIRTELDRQERS